MPMMQFFDHAHDLTSCRNAVLHSRTVDAT